MYADTASRGVTVRLLCKLSMIMSRIITITSLLVYRSQYIQTFLVTLFLNFVIFGNINDQTYHQTSCTHVVMKHAYDLYVCVRLYAMCVCITC